jgi:hypothetical protein
MDELDATPLQSVRATLYQLNLYTEEHVIDGKRVTFVPTWAIEAMKFWLKEAEQQLRAKHEEAKS